jgi:hypothetical protein
MAVHHVATYIREYDNYISKALIGRINKLGNEVKNKLKCT